MLAIDTNVVVRLLTSDDLAQAEKARRLLQTENVFIASTVLLETEWALRGAYGLAKPNVLAALSRLAGLPWVTLEHPARVARALTLASGGLDFADAFHLTAAEACEAFITFDRKLASLASAAASVPVRVL